MSRWQFDPYKSAVAHPCVYRSVPLGAALHLTYELRFVGGEYPLEDEITYWRIRQLRGEVVPVRYAPRAGVPHPHKLDSIYTQHREIGYELTHNERQPGSHFRVTRTGVRTTQATGH